MDLSHFLGALERSRLLAGIDLDACRQRARQEQHLTPEQLAEELQKLGKLSSYQRRKLLDGRSSGFLLGAYEILAPLGKGGMGYVYLARDHEHQRLVALKVVSPRQKAAHPSLLPRLEREMTFSRRLAHPGVVKVYALIEHNGVHCLAMEHVQGLDLFRLVRRQGVLSPVIAAHLLAQAAVALDEVHRRGIVHTDLKPGNLLVNSGQCAIDRQRDPSRNGQPTGEQPKPTVKIIDFGLALDLSNPERNHEAVRPGRIAGTFGYAAPEQTKAGLDVGPAADIFALGSTLFYLLTGEVPFNGPTTREKIRKIRHEAPAWYLLPAGTPTALRRLMQSMLAKRPKHRPGTAGLAADGLLRAVK